MRKIPKLTVHGACDQCSYAFFAMSVCHSSEVWVLRSRMDEQAKLGISLNATVLSAVLLCSVLTLWLVFMAAKWACTAAGNTLHD